MGLNHDSVFATIKNMCTTLVDAPIGIIRCSSPYSERSSKELDRMSAIENRIARGLVFLECGSMCRSTLLLFVWPAGEPQVADEVFSFVNTGPSNNRIDVKPL